MIRPLSGANPKQTYSFKVWMERRPVFSSSSPTTIKLRRRRCRIEKGQGSPLPRVGVGRRRRSVPNRSAAYGSVSGRGRRYPQGLTIAATVADEKGRTWRAAASPSRARAARLAGASAARPRAGGPGATSCASRGRQRARLRAPVSPARGLGRGRARSELIMLHLATKGFDMATRERRGGADHQRALLAESSLAFGYIVYQLRKVPDHIEGASAPLTSSCERDHPAHARLHAERRAPALPPERRLDPVKQIPPKGMPNWEHPPMSPSRWCRQI